MSYSIFNSKRVALIAIISGILSTSFLFQNCSQTKTDSLTSDNTQISSGVVAQKIELKDEKISQVDLLVEGSRVVTQNGRQFSIKEEQNLQIDLESGRVHSASQPESVHCLTDDLKSELATILNSASICKKEVAQDTVCTQVVKSAYAEIHAERESFKLGIFANNCNGEYLDLCDEQSEMLKSFGLAIKAKLADLKCQ